MKNKKKHDSPMQVKYWLMRINPNTEKLYTEEEAILHIKSFRKSNIEYWLRIGYSREKAEQLRKDYQQTAAKRAAEEKKLHPEYDSVHIEYWLKKGYSLEDAKLKLSERQRTFTLEKCIQKYGKKHGMQIYQDRQVKWQNTLNKKSKIEKDKMNKSKNTFSYFYNAKPEDKDKEFWKKWKIVCEKRHMIYVDSIEDVKDEIETLFKKTVAIFGKNAEWFLRNSCPPYLYKIFNISKSTVRKWLTDLNVDIQTTYRVPGRYNSYHMLLDNGDILLSKLEILFYNLLLFKGIKIDATNEKYPNSNLRFDFKINGFYIEIAGLMYDESYKSKIIYKRDTFKSMILTKKSEFNNFIQKVLIEHDEKTIQYYLTRSL